MTSGRKHKNIKVSKIGLVILEEAPYIAASPDFEVTCDCCGRGVGEIKCPYSICENIPSADNLPYLDWHQGIMALKLVDSSSTISTTSKYRDRWL